jgi:hypothetical protein
MSKPVRRSFTCACGQSFDADVFRSVNVTRQPDLKDDILAGRFNRVRCPYCGEETAAEVPFLYHDEDAGRMIWVYPASSADRSEAIREKIERSRAIVDSVLPAGEPDLVFGLDDLRRRL